MQVLITRPREDAEPLARQLRAAGHEVCIEPMMTIRPVAGPPPDLKRFQAVLLTSANGARALARVTTVRDRPVFAVGAATARAARAAGFHPVEEAAGDVDALARLVAERLAPDAGPLLHVAGTVVAGDLAGQLASRKFTMERAVLYEACAAARISDETAAALSAGAIDMALFFSPRTARIFADLAQAQGLDEACRGVIAGCLSAQVAKAAAALTWRDVVTAPEPRQDALLNCLGLQS